MVDVFFDIETKELLDQNVPDPGAAIRALHMSVGVSWCECHDAQVFHGTAPLAEHLLAHDRIIGFNNIHFDNTVLAWSLASRRGHSQIQSGLDASRDDLRLERPVHDSFDSVTGKRSVEKPVAKHHADASSGSSVFQGRDAVRLPDAPAELKKLLDAKSFDLLADLAARLGHRVSLAALAEGTLGKQKMASGPQAVVWNRLAVTLRDKWPYALADVGDTEGAQRVNELGRWFQERLEQYCLQDVLLAKKIFDYGIANKRVAFVDFEGERRVVKVQWR